MQNSNRRKLKIRYGGNQKRRRWIQHQSSCIISSVVSFVAYTSVAYIKKREYQVFSLVDFSGLREGGGGGGKY